MKNIKYIRTLLNFKKCVITGDFNSDNETREKIKEIIKFFDLNKISPKKTFIYKGNINGFLS